MFKQLLKVRYVMLTFEGFLLRASALSCLAPALIDDSSKSYKPPRIEAMANVG